MMDQPSLFESDRATVRPHEPTVDFIAGQIGYHAMARTGPQRKLTAAERGKMRELARDVLSRAIDALTT